MHEMKKSCMGNAIIFANYHVHINFYCSPLMVYYPVITWIYTINIILKRSMEYLC